MDVAQTAAARARTLARAFPRIPVAGGYRDDGNLEPDTTPDGGRRPPAGGIPACRRARARSRSTEARAASADRFATEPGRPARSDLRCAAPSSLTFPAASSRQATRTTDASAGPRGNGESLELDSEADPAFGAITVSARRGGIAIQSHKHRGAERLPAIGTAAGNAHRGDRSRTGVAIRAAPRLLRPQQRHSAQWGQSRLHHD